MGAFSAWRPRTINVGGHLVGVFDIVPDNPVSPIPVVICPGWVEVPASWTWHAERLAERGRRVIAYDAPHGLAIPMEVGVPRTHHIELQKMQTYVAVMRTLGIDRADLVGRSEGAIWALLTAVYYPQMIHNIVLQNPAGLIGRDWFLPFLIRWLRDMKQTIRNETGDPKPFAPVPAPSVMARDWQKTVQEIWAIMHCDSRQALQEVHSIGIKIAVVTTDHDRLFPDELIRKHSGDWIDVLRTLNGGHTSFFCRPEEFSDAIAKVLDEFDRLD